MKRIAPLILCLTLVATLCFAAGDPVSTTERKGKAQVTTYKRDGTNILRCALWSPNDPEKRILRQEVLIGDITVAVLLDFQGKQTINIQPNIPVEFGTTHSTTGGFEGIVLMDDTHTILEAYEVKEGRLLPFAGWKLEGVQEATSGFSQLVDAVREEKEPKEELMGRVTDIVIKAKLKEMQNMQVEPSSTSAGAD